MKSFERNAFDDARLVEAKSLVALHPFLIETHGHYVLTDKGNLAKFLQETIGDLAFNSPTGRLFGVECKAEKRWTGNLFLELWSNRNLENQSNFSYVGSKQGWLYTCRADLLFYHFLDNDKLVICNMFALRRWAFVQPSKNMSEPRGDGVKSQLPGRIFDFPELEQKQREQLNDTRGRLVPISLLQREMQTPAKIVSVKQLTMDIFGDEEAA